MKLLQLTVIVRDVQTSTMTAQAFTRSPVLVGRQFGNQLRLDARTVSRRHGAFLFSKDGLQYIDYRSANGSYVDGIRVDPNRAVDVRDSSVITIAPFQIVAHMDLVDSHRVSSDPNASTPLIALLPPRSRPPELRSWQHILDNGAALHRVASLRESLELAQRATRVIEVMSDGLLAAGSRTARTPSPLRLAGTSAEMVALLLDAGTADERLVELRALLAELLRPRLSPVP